MENLTEIKNLTQNLTSTQGLGDEARCLTEQKRLCTFFRKLANVVRSVSLASLGLLKYGKEDYKMEIQCQNYLYAYRLQRRRVENEEFEW